MNEEGLNVKTRVLATVYPVDDLMPRQEWAPATHYWDTGLEPDLKYLYDTIGAGCVARVRLPVGDLWIDDDGHARGRRLNLGANALCQQQGIHVSESWCIVGTAVLVPREAKEADSNEQ